MTLDLSAHEVLTTTRSVRKRLDLDRPVEPEVIRACVRLATHAPNAINAQTWRWLVITEPGVRSAVGDIYREALLPIMVLIWHIVAVNGWVDPLVSRTPGQVWSYLVEGWRSGEIMDNLAATMEAVVIAFSLASVVGIRPT